MLCMATIIVNGCSNNKPWHPSICATGTLLVGQKSELMHAANIVHGSQRVANKYRDLIAVRVSPAESERSFHPLMFRESDRLGSRIP